MKPISVSSIVLLSSHLFTGLSIGFKFPNQNSVLISHLTHACYTYRPAHASWIDCTWRRVHTVKLFIMQVRFQVLTAASMKFRFVFWDVMPCKIIVYRRFRCTFCLHHQGNEWWWRQHVPLKRRTTIILHGSTSHKTDLN
jgi:hypothetical protein